MNPSWFATVGSSHRKSSTYLATQADEKKQDGEGSNGEANDGGDERTLHQRVLRPAVTAFKVIL